MSSIQAPSPRRSRRMLALTSSARLAQQLAHPIFHHFPSLPQELQLKIWTLAASTLKLDQEYLLFFYYPQNDGYARILGPRLSVQPNALFFEQSLQRGNAGDVEIGKMRECLMETCRVARLMTLEVWRREIGLLKLGEWYREVKGEMIERAERMIGEVKARLEG